MYSPKQVSEILKIPTSTIRRYSVDYAQHLSETAKPAKGKRFYTDGDVLLLKKIRELVTAKKSPEDINRLLLVVDTGSQDGTPSALALLPDVAQAFEDIRALLNQERAEREQLAQRLSELEEWLGLPWYKKIGRKPPTKT